MLIPDERAGCSLADSITPQDVRCAQAYPGVPVITYVNTSAAVKAECDICCTSGNAVKVVNRSAWIASFLAGRISRELRGDPDQGTDHQVEGHCEVHERFTGDEVQLSRGFRIWW